MVSCKSFFISCTHTKKTFRLEKSLSNNSGCHLTCTLKTIRIPSKKTHKQTCTVSVKDISKKTNTLKTFYNYIEYQQNSTLHAPLAPDTIFVDIFLISRGNINEVPRGNQIKILGKPEVLETLSRFRYTPGSTNIAGWKIPIFPGKYHQNGGCLIAMIGFQGVYMTQVP